RLPELRHWNTGVEQERPGGAWAGLRQLLCGQHTEREAAVDDLAGQVVRFARSALDQVSEADLRCVRHAFVDRRKRPTVEQVRCVHRVTDVSQFVCKPLEAFRLTLCVVEEEHLGHLASFGYVAVGGAPTACQAMTASRRTP